MSNASGYADLAIRLEGSLHRGTIYVLARRSGAYGHIRNSWSTSERIDLLAKRPSPALALGAH